MAGLFQATSKQRNPLGTTIRTHGSGKYTFGLALSAGQYPRSACLFLSAPRGMRHLPDQCHQLHHRLLRFQKLGCQRRLALDAEAGCDSGRRVPALHGASTGKPTIPHSSRQKPKRDSRCSSTSSAPNRHAFALTTSMHRSNSKPKCRMNFTTCSAQGCRRRSSSAL